MTHHSHSLSIFHFLNWDGSLNRVIESCERTLKMARSISVKKERKCASRADLRKGRKVRLAQAQLTKDSCVSIAGGNNL